MDYKQEAERLIELFGGNKEFAAKCVKEIMKECYPHDQHQFDYWSKVLTHINDTK